MPRRPHHARHLLALGLIVAAGYAFGVLSLGGCAGASWPSNGTLPEKIVDRLTDCGKKGPTPLTSIHYDLAFTVHVSEESDEARVDDVLLTSSTLHLPEVEACMADALYAMRTPLETLALRGRRRSPDQTITPESRELLGQLETALFLEAGVMIVVGYATYKVMVQLLLDKPHATHKPLPAPSTTSMPPPPVAATTAQPTATAAPTATSVPVATAVPKARRYPNQTCEDDELDRLEQAKDKLCKSGYATTCGEPTKPKSAKTPCSAILLAIRQRQACRDARKAVQDRCFGGKPDSGHATAIEQEENAIRKCESLKLVNCAKGHPMAGL